MNDQRYWRRAADDDLDWCLSRFACVRITGPRSIGKTTTARRRARQHYDMSDFADRQLMDEYGGELLRRGPYPILIDEWQSHPDLLWEVKRIIDASDRKGLFIVAGSPTWRVSDTRRGPWALTGRTVEIQMTPMPVTERLGAGAPGFIRWMFDAAASAQDVLADMAERVLAGEAPEQMALPLPAGGVQPAWPSASGEGEGGSSASRRIGSFDYVFDSGYPELAGLPDAEQRRGHEGLVEAVIANDLPERLDRGKFMTFLEVCAQHSSEDIALQKLADKTEVSRVTAESYRTMAANAGLIHRVKPWNVVLRETARKRQRQYISDPGMCTHLAEVRPAQLLRDGNVRGALLETFVAAQLRAEIQASRQSYRLGHFRDQFGDVDLIVEDRETGAVLMIEVKSRTYPKSDDAKHIRRLRDAIDASTDTGLHFAAGVVLHTGDRVVKLRRQRGQADVTTNLVGLPLRALWELR